MTTELIAPGEAGTAHRLLPSHVLVLSGDGREWSREWGVKQILFNVLSDPARLGLENSESIHFGPYRKGWPIPGYFCILDRLGVQISEWTPFAQPFWHLAPGDTLNFAPGAIVVSMTMEGFSPPASSPAPTAPRELEAPRKALPWWKR